MLIMMSYSRPWRKAGSQSRGVAAEAGRWVWAEASRRIVATVCMTVSVIALAAVLPASADPNLPASWWNPEWAFCVPELTKIGNWKFRRKGRWSN